MIPLFRDRADAGRRLAERLVHLAYRPDVLVLALPRGGVPVGYEVARTLRVPLDVMLVRKLGLPWHPEVAMGALASGGVRVIDWKLVRDARVSREVLDQVVLAEHAELERRERLYRDARPFPPVAGRTVILVDDGVATGSSLRAAIHALRTLRPERIVVGVPVAPAPVVAALRREVQEVEAVAAPTPFYAVGAYYQRFEQLSDDEVREILRRADAAAVTRAGPAG